MLTSSRSFLWKFFVVLKPLAGSEAPWDQTSRNQIPMGLILTESDPAGADSPGNQIAPGSDTHRDLISLYVISIGIRFYEVWYPSVSDSQGLMPRGIWFGLSYPTGYQTRQNVQIKKSPQIYWKRESEYNSGSESGSPDGADEWKKPEGENIVILSL
jgi:hypothetical protein